MSRPYLSVVIPSFRQVDTIVHDLNRLNHLVKRLVPSHELILVIDGNEDGTLTKVRQLHWPELKIECFHRNQGKGAALRHGLNRSQGQIVAFIDAGSDISAASLEVMLALLKLYRADMVIGSKRHPLSEVNYPRLRRVYSFGYQLLNRLLFRLRVHDTQVGLKLCRREVLATVLPRIVVKKFAFDLELLVVAHHLGFRRIVEAPVKIDYNFSSTIGVSAVWRTFWDTLAIFYRLRIIHWYDRPVRSLPTPVQPATGVIIHHDTPSLHEKVQI
ncbi:MAG: glycosyltransferase family 2 protein [Candidatus Andersenbacteria bacterium]|nr:glycosyltransferase family 2 protein [bacterium]MDZ4225448.1 glycosyltransferase family 2 protein [Candidatus Andersenbacteria bacterium]